MICSHFIDKSYLILRCLIGTAFRLSKRSCAKSYLILRCLIGTLSLPSMIKRRQILPYSSVPNRNRIATPIIFRTQILPYSSVPNRNLRNGGKNLFRQILPYSSVPNRNEFREAGGKKDQILPYSSVPYRYFGNKLKPSFSPFNYKVFAPFTLFPFDFDAFIFHIFYQNLSFIICSNNCQRTISYDNKD